MKLKDYLAAERGRCARVAAAVGVAPAYMSQMSNGVRPVPPQLAPEIVTACEQQVALWELRADWYLIWPHVVGCEGAPEAPASVRRPEVSGRPSAAAMPQGELFNTGPDGERRSPKRDEQTCEPSPIAYGVEPEKSRDDETAELLQRDLERRQAAAAKPVSGGRDRTTRMSERGGC